MPGRGDRVLGLGLGLCLGDAGILSSHEFLGG